jgi:hypothetical protein
MLKVIGGEQEGEFKAVASGTLPNGKPVVVNADGTVSVAGETSGTESIGTEVQFESGAIVNNCSAYDTANDRVVIAYRDNGNSNYGTAIVGTVSGTSISFGTPVVFLTANFAHTSMTFDSINNKIVIAFMDVGNSNYGTGIVGTVSGTSISFGTKVVFESAGIEQTSSAFDVNAGKVVIAYRDDGNSTSGTAVVGTVSGTSISFGTPVVFNSGSSGDYSAVYNPDAQNIIIAYRRGSDTSGQAVVGTVSGTSISFGSPNEFTTNNCNYVEAAYDVASQKIVVAYQDGIDGSKGKAVVGSISGNTITFGTPVVFNSASTIYLWIAYHAVAQKIVISYIDETGTLNYGKFITGTVSGTSITFASASTFAATYTNFTNLVYDPDTEQMVLNFRDEADSNRGKAIVFQIDYTVSNLTAENYIGMSRGVTDVQATSAGTPVVFEAASTNYVYSIYDPDTNKVIIAYRDTGNSNYGTAIVGTVSGTSITFGSPVVFNSANSFYMNLTYDTVNNKVVIPYQDGGNSNYGTAIVGTVSGTSISFGSPTVFETGTAEYVSSTYDANAQKVVICYQDQQNGPYYGTAVVGTVSGTSISFGTPVVFYSGTMNDTWVVYDSTAQKVVIPYQDEANSNRGVAVVGTVSGTSISFGSPVVFDSGSTDQITAFYEPVSGKVLIGYIKTGEGDVVVGTVSGTSISFGTPVAFSSVTASELSITYDTNRSKVVVVYRNSSLVGALNTGTISGDSITFDGEFVFNADAITNTNRAVYDTLNQKVVNTYNDATLSQGTTSVITIGYENRYPVADGNPASIDIIGSVSENQLSLTAGEKYYVQTDGTLSTTAGTPSVLAGTAISATKLVVKT